MGIVLCQEPILICLTSASSLQPSFHLAFLWLDSLSFSLNVYNLHCNTGITQFYKMLTNIIQLTIYVIFCFKYFTCQIGYFLFGHVLNIVFQDKGILKLFNKRTKERPTKPMGWEMEILGIFIFKKCNIWPVKQGDHKNIQLFSLENICFKVVQA